MKRVLQIMTCVLGICLAAPLAWADYAISVIPHRGGTSLSFGMLDTGEIQTQELEVKVTSTGIPTTAAYQLRQEVLGAFTNETGKTLDLNAIKFYPLSQAETRGTFNYTTPQSLFTGTIYNSKAPSAGTRDLFYLVFDVDESLIKNSGTYRGRIRYVVAPVSGGGTEQSKILDVELQAQKEFSVTVNTQAGIFANPTSQNPVKVELSTLDDIRQKAYAKFVYNGILGEKFELEQVQQAQFINEDTGEPVDLKDAVTFYVEGQAGTPAYPGPANFAAVGRPAAVYVSNDRGSADNVWIYFVVDKEKTKQVPVKIAAGKDRVKYKADFIYRTKQGQQVIDEKPLQLSVELSPTFEIAVSSENQKGVQFSNLKPGTSVTASDVLVKVQTNTGRPYRVIQHIANPLATEKGELLDLKYFSFRQTLDEGQPGEIKFVDAAPLSTVDKEIYASDSKGSTAEFKMIYSVDLPRDAKSGDYSVDVSYSLLEQ